MLLAVNQFIIILPLLRIQSAFKHELSSWDLQFTSRNSAAVRPGWQGRQRQAVREEPEQYPDIGRGLTMICMLFKIRFVSRFVMAQRTADNVLHREFQWSIE